jgi:large subunit ribosomal protein L30
VLLTENSKENKENKMEEQKVEAKEKKKEVSQGKPSQKSLLAAVLIRGKVGLEAGVKENLLRLNLIKKHNCVLLEDTPVNRGMLNKVTSLVAWGPVSEDVASKVRSRNATKKKEVKLKSYALHPPRGGFERKGIKQPHTKGGALGKRESMDKLLTKMI